jgi:carbon monoxide dehydrogenase subunit G
VAQHAALLAKASQTVADPQVRHRGTFGGALVHADPGRRPAGTGARDGRRVRDRRSGRHPYRRGGRLLRRTCSPLLVGEDEILTEVRVPKFTGWGAHYEKFTRVAQQWSIVAVAATVRVEGGIIAEARVALTNMDTVPVRSLAAEQALVGTPVEEGAITPGARRHRRRHQSADRHQRRRRLPLAPRGGARPAGGAGRGRLTDMELNHRFTVPAPIEDTWAAFNDLERVAPCFPGAELTSVDGDEFTGSCKVKLGPISLLYTGKGTFLERDESTYRALIEAKGKDKRGNGTAGAKVTAQLHAEGDSTVVEVATDLQITGKPAQFGRGVIQDVSDRLLDQFVTCLQQELLRSRLLWRSRRCWPRRWWPRLRWLRRVPGRSRLPLRRLRRTVRQTRR